MPLLCVAFSPCCLLLAGSRSGTNYCGRFPTYCRREPSVRDLQCVLGAWASSCTRLRRAGGGVSCVRLTRAGCGGPGLGGLGQRHFVESLRSCSGQTDTSPWQANEGGGFALVLRGDVMIIILTAGRRIGFRSVCFGSPHWMHGRSLLTRQLLEQRRGWGRKITGVRRQGILV